MTISDDVDQLLTSGGGPSAFNKDTPVGTTVKGVIEAASVRQQTDFVTGEPMVWKDGNPRLELVVTLSTDLGDGADDDGTRRLFARGNLLLAIKDAVGKSGAKTIEVGGKLAVKFTGLGTPSAPGLNAPKLYTAQYMAPVNAPVDVDDLL